MAAGTAKADVKELEKEIEDLKDTIERLKAVNEEQAKSLRESLKRKPGDALIIAPLKRTGRFVARRLDMALPRPEAQALRDLFDALYERQEKLKSGKPVENPRQALLWLLERLVP